MKLLMPLLFIASFAQAQSTESALVEEPNFRQIFGQSVSEAATLNQERRESGATLEIGPAWLSPSNMTLRNRYYESALADTVGGLPGAQLHVGMGLASMGPARLSLDTGLAYSFGQGVGPARSVKTGLLVTDSFRVHWIEGSVALRTAFPIGSIAPYLQGSVAAVRAMRSAFLDGQNESFWIPVAGATVGAVFGGQDASSTWFGGVSASLTYESHLNGDQDYRGLRYELSLRTRL